MPVSKREIDRRVVAMIEAMRAAGLRVTHQRLEVAREVSSTDEHPDVESIYRAVRLRVPTISLDTVYRTLGVLTDRGLVTRVHATGGAARYDANLDQHHHFVCSRCGSVHDVEDAALEGLRPAAVSSAFGRIESLEVRLRGVCPRCEGAEQ